MAKLNFVERKYMDMDFYNCPYVVIIPFRNGNEYDEGYGCEVMKRNCLGCQCEMTSEECQYEIQKQLNNI